jgi:microcystin-dependent protein
MTTSFPTGLDALTNPTSADGLNSPDHAGQHANVNDAVEALEAKVGVDGSAVTSSLDYKVAKNILANPVGMISPYAGSTAPTDWQLCYGQAISRTTYSSLFAIISTTYGVGDGSTTFNVPDLRGRTVAGIDNMGGTDAGRLSTANTLGTSTGAETVTLTSAQSGVPAHGHANTATFSGSFSGTAGTTGNDSPDHTHNVGWDGGALDAGGISIWGLQGSGNNKVTSGASARHTHSFTPAGSISGSVTMNNVNNTVANAASAHTNMQPTMVLNYIIFAGA